jgi:antitoxin ParD1/3/4
MFSKNPSLHCRRQALKNAIQEGIDSGMAENFDAKRHLKTLKADKKKNGYSNYI